MQTEKKPIELYYEAPSEEVFNDIKTSCLLVWAEYNEPIERTYRAEKFKKVVPLKNIRDNYMFMIAMFDHINQKKLFEWLRSETLVRVQQALEPAQMEARWIETELNRRTYDKNQ